MMKQISFIIPRIYARNCHCICNHSGVLMKTGIHITAGQKDTNMLITPIWNTGRTQSLFAMALLCIITALAYRGVIHNNFVSFDDIEYIFENRHVYDGLTFNGLVWAVSGVHLANWSPVTWVSHMTDMSLFGANPGGHHMTSLVLHLINIVLLQILLTRMTGALWRSAAVSAVFALHPLQVESVAWIAERKTVLCTLFFLLTLLAYYRFTRNRTILNYSAVMLSYLCGLASKPMLVSLPLILLLLDMWPLRRTAACNHIPGTTTGDTMARLVMEKIPLLILAAASCLITIFTQHSGGAIKWSGTFSLVENAAHALVNYVTYLYIVFWPVDLAVLYPYKKTLPVWQPGGALVLLVLLSALAVRSAPTRPYWAFGWFWFIITLLPVAGIIRIGAHSVADRYLYIPLIGIAVAIVWLIGDLLEGTRRGRIFAVTGAAVMYGTLCVLTTNQVGYWKDTVTLFEHAIAVTSGNWLAHNNITIELVKQGQIEKALQHAQESIRINPDNSDAYYNLGKIYSNLGDNTQAIRAYQAAITTNPGNANAYLKLTMLFLEAGDRTSASETYRILERIDPDKARFIQPSQSLITLPSK